MRSVLEQLASASSQARQDKNIALAQAIAGNNNVAAVQELIDGLQHKTKAIRHDCIKTLYEIAVIKAGLVSSHVNVFVTLLGDKDNRMQWGAMTAISAVTTLTPEAVYKALGRIIATADAGSVITTDHAVKILATLALTEKYRDTVIPLLLDQLLQAPVNQAPSYAEQILPVVTAKDKDHFKKILLMRIGDTEQDSKKKRLEKVLKKLQ